MKLNFNMVLFIILILVILYIKYNPKIDIIKNNKILLWYNYKSKRKFVTLLNMK